MKDKTPLIHAAFALALQLAIGLLFGDWIIGGVLACTWWIAREHTQAEYRWIEKYGQGLRVNMPEWAGFDYRVWNVSSLLDFVAPIAACIVTYFAALALGWYERPCPTLH